MNKRISLFIIASLVSALLSSAFAQENEDTYTKELLQYDIEELMNLTFVTATRTEVRFKEAPAAVYVITDRMIRERGYRTLSDALHDIPGIDFQHTYGIWPDLFHQRGLIGNNQRSLLYIDGILDNNISEGAIRGGGNIRFPLHNVKRIEIVSGPASALFGANAFNGVINIITKDGKEDPGNEVQATVGAYLDGDKMDGDYTGESGSFSLRGKVGIGERDGQYSISGFYLKSVGPDFRGINGLDENNKGYFWSDYYNNSHDETYNVTAKFSFGNLNFEMISWQYLQGQGTFANGHYQIDTDERGFEGSNWDYSNNAIRIGHLLEQDSTLKLESEIIVRHTDLLSSSHEQPVPKDEQTPDIYNFPDDVTTRSDYARPDYSYEVEERLTWEPSKRFNSLLGVEAIRSVVPEDYGSYQRHQFDNYGTYIQGVYKPVETLSLTGGYRFDHNTDYGSSHSPRIGAVWTPGDFVVKALVGTGFRAPNPWELFNSTDQRKANPDLEPETMRSYELGVGYTLFKRHHFSVTGYYNEIENLILEVARKDDPNPNYTDTDWNQNQNIGEAKIKGVEATADIQILNNLCLYANYTYSKGEYKDLPTTLINSPAVLNGDEVPNIAPHKINSGITYSILPDLTFHVRANYVHKRETISTNPTRSVDGYTLLHTNIRWEDAFVNGLYVQFLCRNLLDEKAFDPGVRTAKGTYYPTQDPVEGRNVWLTMGYKF